MIRAKRNYRAWVANETLEDYALRYAAKSYRKWSPLLLANTALGGISFLALEAIGGAITISYGFYNAFIAIVLVSLIIFLTNLPIAYYAGKYHIDMDLLTRGAGFGYIGSTITSLIYASFTFIFFALEAAIMAQALELYFDLPLVLGYVLSSLVIIPITFFGVTLINRLQIWTQPLWVVLFVLPFVCVFLKNPAILAQWAAFGGKTGHGAGFDMLAFGAATGVLFALVVQIGEQVDYLRFLPERHTTKQRRWWWALIAAGPGWIALGGLKILAGSLLAFIGVEAGVSFADAIEPIHMYIKAYEFVFDDDQWVLGFATLFVVLSQVKINVTNAYAGSLAWSNFFARLAHYHPGRVVWLVFNVIIALLLMLLGIFETLEAVLSIYSIVAIAWIGAIVADLTVLKPLGVSPPYIEFKRAHLYNINPVGCGAMLIASLLAISAYAGEFGETAKVYAAFLSLLTAFACAVLLGVLTQGRYYIARQSLLPPRANTSDTLRCIVCEQHYEFEDMAQCPFYDGPICSLCCSLDNHCHDICKTPERYQAVAPFRSAPSLNQRTFQPNLARRLGWFLGLFSIVAIAAGIFFLLSYRLLEADPGPGTNLADIFLRLYLGALALIAIGVWWITLAHESRELAESELVNSLHYLEMTRQELVQSEKMASLGGLVAGVAHEINTPVGIMVSAASFLRDQSEAVRGQLGAGQLTPQAWEAFLNRAEDSARLLLSNANRTAALVQSFKQVAVDRVSDERRTFNLRDYIGETLTSLKPKLKRSRLSVTVDCPPDIQIDGYPGPLAQILTNFIMNSLMHGYDEHQIGAIRISARRTGDDGLELRYADDGKGIPRAIQGKIFEPFFTTQRSRGGSGLGLHLVYNIVTRQLNGTISVESEAGQGAAFVLRLPLRQSAPVELSDSTAGASADD
ncbi:MAG: ATP-binding protein [Gammaproteobacteria bacterium]